MRIAHTCDRVWSKRGFFSDVFRNNFMSPSLSNLERQCYEFGDFRLVPEERLLLKNDKSVNLSPKIFDLLVLLVENEGRLIEKSDLLDRLWSETFVEEATLARAISNLRKSIDENQANKYIETVSKRGYRFIATVRRVSKDDIRVPDSPVAFKSGKDTSETITDVQKNIVPIRGAEIPEINGLSLRRLSSHPMLLVALLTTSTLAIGLLLSSYWQTEPSRKIRSIAVLPLKSFDMEDDSLSLRITDALITKLNDLEEISVRPTSAVLAYTGDNIDIVKTGRHLKVDAVLDGRIQKEGNRLRVTLQIISIETGETIWSDLFDGNSERLLALQDSISARLLFQLKSHFSERETIVLAKKPTENSDAFENYLKARYFWQKRTPENLANAISFFEQAIELDPDFAAAYAGLADSQYLLFDYSYDTSPKNVALAKANLLRAIQLDPELEAAYIILGLIQTTYDWDWLAAEQSFQKAIAIAPESSDAHHRYALLLLKLRRFSDAEFEIRLAKEYDPTSLSINMNLGVILFYSKQYDAAIRQLNETIELDPAFTASYWYLARCYWLKNEKAKSFATYVRALTLDGDRELAMYIEDRYLKLDYDNISKYWADKWQSRMHLTGINEYDLAILSAHRLNKKDTLNWLEKTVESRHPWAASIYATPEFEFLHNEPRFKSILQKLKLLALDTR